MNDINKNMDNLNLKVYIEGYGCTLNSADTNIIKNSIAFKDFTIVDDLNDADIVVINTCIVRLETEHKMISRINYIKSLNKKIVVAGCMPKALREKVEKLNVGALIMPIEAHLAGDVLCSYIKNENGCALNTKKEINANLDSKLDYLHPNGLIMPLPISEGCIGKCSFCIVKVARGRLLSYSRDKIIKKAPSAGLWKGQTDEKELGITYELLDKVLLAIEQNKEKEDISKELTVPIEKIEEILNRIELNKHKSKPIPIPK